MKKATVKIKKNLKRDSFRKQYLDGNITREKISKMTFGRKKTNNKVKKKKKMAIKNANSFRYCPARYISVLTFFFLGCDYFNINFCLSDYKEGL